MNPQISSPTNSHSDIVLLLPWYVNQSLSTNERQQVDQHLKYCLVCRRELQTLHKLAAAVQQAADLDVAAEASFAGLRAKMQTASQIPRTKQANSPRVKLSGVNVKLFAARHGLWRIASNTGKGLAIAASLLLVALPAAMQYLRPADTTDYFTLSAAKTDAGPTGQLRVVFAKNLANKDIDAALSQIGGVRVDGPNSVGAYTVKIATGKPDTDIAGALALLRSRQDVILAEPILQP
ncbi:anti-sigma factor family protein [Methylomonas rosea]|uniref:Zf-HC2 domain-containing protein n=1 Tax=Methylomonas rosea TaxID=2952227 RepID=A0ABT1TUZ9_9GAMM|nr:zf-HC2 domain-containing protein [Methylomonas sp. WSC-7]MCQ8118589.1 zf-HC2 domain-containing protein [Methylomonas sp. WSC-7]